MSTPALNPPPEALNVDGLRITRRAAGDMHYYLSDHEVIWTGTAWLATQPIPRAARTASGTPAPDWSALNDACMEYSAAYMGDDDSGLPPALDKIRAALAGHDPYNPSGV